MSTNNSTIKDKLKTLKGKIANSKLNTKIPEAYGKYKKVAGSFYEKHKYPIQTFSVIILLLTFVGITTYFLSDKSTFFLKDYATTINVILSIAIFFAVLIFLNQTTSPNDPSVQTNIKQQLFFYGKYMLFMGLTIGLLGGIIYGFSSSATLSIISIYLSLFTAIIVGLYLIHSYIKTTQVYKNIESSGLFNLIYHAIFLIPCLIIDGGFNVAKSVQKTTPFVYHLLLAEIVFIALYFAIPKIYNSVKTHNMKVLLDKPKFINNETTIGTFENLKPAVKDKFQYNYGISLKCFVDQNLPNDSPASIKDTVLFNYGGKPKFTFNVKKNTFKIACKTGVDGSKVIYKTKHLKKQIWNHFIINYDSGTMDVFLNGKLVCSESGLVPYMQYDSVTIGDSPGINGGVKEVYYSNTPFTLAQIKMMS